MAPGETVWVTGAAVKEKSQPPPTAKRSGAVEPSTGSVTLTHSGPAHAICEVGTVAVKVIAFTKVVVSAVPLKLITDCAVKLFPGAVRRKAGAPEFGKPACSTAQVVAEPAVALTLA